MMIVTPERAGHWFYPDGRPCFQVPKKDGKGTKDTTLREARELGLFPSVTGILKVVAKPDLEAWKISQGILAALTLPRIENEPLEAFARRVAKDSQEQAGEAAEFGKQIHKAIERWLLGQVVAEDVELDSYMDSLREWAGHEIEEVYSAEEVVVNLCEGYAGTLDLHCRLKGIGNVVVDFKSQSIKNGKPVFYDEWFFQLAAYAAALDKPRLALVSIVIDSKTPGPIFCHQWPEPERGWQLFKCALELWKYQKQYDPTQSNHEPEKTART